MSRILCVPLIAFLILVIPFQAAAQEITSVQSTGMCQDFEVTVTAANLTEGCWDVKLDIPGEINAGSESEEDWTSTFYYKDRALCSPETDSATLELRLDSRASVVSGTAKLRLDNKVIEKDFEIQQSCPPPAEPLPDFLILVIVFGIIVFFGWLITWWWKQK